MNYNHVMSNVRKLLVTCLTLVGCITRDANASSRYTHHAASSFVTFELYGKPPKLTGLLPESKTISVEMIVQRDGTVKLLTYVRLDDAASGLQSARRWKIATYAMALVATGALADSYTRLRFAGDRFQYRRIFDQRVPWMLVSGLCFPFLCHASWSCFGHETQWLNALQAPRGTMDVLFRDSEATVPFVQFCADNLKENSLHPGRGKVADGVVPIKVMVHKDMALRFANACIDASIDVLFRVTQSVERQSHIDRISWLMTAMEADAPVKNYRWQDVPVHIDLSDVKVSPASKEFCTPFQRTLPYRFVSGTWNLLKRTVTAGAQTVLG